METGIQQLDILKTKDVEISKTKIDVQSHTESNLEVGQSQINSLEEQSNRSDYEDGDVTVIASWFGDQKLDVLTAEDWIGSVQRAKDQFEWSDEVTMTNIVNALFGDALAWFLDLVTMLST